MVLSLMLLLLCSAQSASHLLLFYSSIPINILILHCESCVWSPAFGVLRHVLPPAASPAREHSPRRVGVTLRASAAHSLARRSPASRFIHRPFHLAMAQWLRLPSRLNVGSLAQPLSSGEVRLTPPSRSPFGAAASGGEQNRLFSSSSSPQPRDC